LTSDDDTPVGNTHNDERSKAESLAAFLQSWHEARRHPQATFLAQRNEQHGPDAAEFKGGTEYRIVDFGSSPALTAARPPRVATRPCRQPALRNPGVA
jgi:hypothetical protein